MEKTGNFAERKYDIFEVDGEHEKEMRKI